MKSLLIALAACAPVAPPPVAPPTRTAPPSTISAAPDNVTAPATPVVAAAENCFAGFWKGTGDHHRAFTVTFAQDGTALRGTFAWHDEGAGPRIDDVTGTADCAAMTAKLAGAATYVLALHPNAQRYNTFFDGTWSCGRDCGGTLKGYGNDPP